MMAAAYAYAENGGPMPRELYILNCIDRFGVQPTLGKLVLGAKEIRLMAICENVVNGYRERERAEDFTKWTDANPDKSAVLNAALRAAWKLGYLNHA